MTRKTKQARLNVENLEGRELPATVLGLSANLAPVTAAQSSQFDAPLKLIYASADSVPLARSWDFVSGVRVNHNETLVRARRARRRKGR